MDQKGMINILNDIANISKRLSGIERENEIVFLSIGC